MIDPLLRAAHDKHTAPAPTPEEVQDLRDKLTAMEADRNTWRKKAEDRRRWGRRDLETMLKRKTKEKQRAEAAEAKLAEVEKLASAWEGMGTAEFNLVPAKAARDLRTALTGDKL